MLCAAWKDTDTLRYNNYTDENVALFVFRPASTVFQ